MTDGGLKTVKIYDAARLSKCHSLFFLHSNCSCVISPKKQPKTTETVTLYFEPFPFLKDCGKMIYPPHAFTYAWPKKKLRLVWCVNVVEGGGAEDVGVGRSTGMDRKTPEISIQFRGRWSTMNVKIL